MLTFIRSQIASITATIIDFSVTILLVNLFHFNYVVGSAIGTISGGVTYFLMGRNWVFEAGDGKTYSQVIKYTMVWIVYLLLSTGSVFVITRYGGLNYLLSKAAVAVLMSVSYNYVLNKKFVFK